MPRLSGFRSDSPLPFISHECRHCGPFRCPNPACGFARSSNAVRFLAEASLLGLRVRSVSAVDYCACNDRLTWFPTTGCLRFSVLPSHVNEHALAVPVPPPVATSCCRLSSIRSRRRCSVVAGMSMGLCKCRSCNWLLPGRWSVTTTALPYGSCLVPGALGTVHKEKHVRHLERLVSFDQLLSYPSEYAGFNRAYEDALSCLNARSEPRELYIVQYRARHNVAGSGEDLYFSFVPSQLISSEGPYFLTDFCAVVRNQPSTTNS